MNKTIYFSGRENAGKRYRDGTGKVRKMGFNQPDSSNRSALAMTVGKPTSSLAVAIAILSGCLVSAGPAHARFDIPTGAPASPLFGATEFSQRMLLFEEFGTQPIPSSADSTNPMLPAPSGCDNMPAGGELDAFLSKSLYPLPGKFADTTLANPWGTLIKDCITGVSKTYMDGRPPGEWFAHQRWDEFKPKVFFQTAMTGARINGGLRDQYQMHRYQMGEFAPGGLYHNTVGLAGFDGTTKGIEIRFHPNMPIQDPKALWTFDGTLPPKLLMARYGESILFRHHNALPIDPAANNGFGIHTITTHEHNGHNPAESDGFTHAYSYPGQYFDYRWPMILAGHDSINTDASNPRAGYPNGSGGITKIRGDWRETMSTHWFHDHMLDYTAQNVYKGNAAMMNYYSAVDRGNEAINDGINLRFPSGTALDWGNRDYDVNLVVADKAWDNNGQLYFNIFNTDGFVGDRMTVNFLYKPYLDVRARRYRFRILDGSVSRHLKIAVVKQDGTRVPFHMIANDGNIMEHAIPFPNAQSSDLPEQGIAERYDIIVDFAGLAGQKLYLVNLMEHVDGKGPKQAIPLADVLSGKYQPNGKDGDPAVGKFLEFRVQAYSGTDLSMNPADYVEGKKQMIPLPKIEAAELANAKHRTFTFGRSGGTDTQPWTIETDGGPGLNMDPHRLSAAPDKGSLEVWHIIRGGNGWSHPVHIHFEEGRILRRDEQAPPLWEKWARKDVYRIGPLPDSGNSLEVAFRVRDFMGTYVEHCHNTQHEDKAMLLRWDSENPGQTISIPTPMPEWNGVAYEDTFTLPTFKTGDEAVAAAYTPPIVTNTEDPPTDNNPPPPPGPSDTVTITSASLAKSGLEVQGNVVPFRNNTSVTLFNGAESNGNCTGTSFATAQIKQGGTFTYKVAVKKLTATPVTVCVLSPGGDVDDAPVQ